MNPSTKRRFIIFSCALAALLMCGCAHKKTTYHPTGAIEGFGGLYNSGTVEENGILYQRSAMAYPTGKHESSGLMVEKMVPVEVMIGKPFEYRYKVSNLTEHPIHMVVVSDRMDPNFTEADSEPKATELRDGVATWQLGSLGPKESTVVKVTGVAKAEGALNTCGWASYSPMLCTDVRVVRPELQFGWRIPSQSIICDPIPVTLTVKNAGTSRLTAVKVTQDLPEGLTSNGQRTLSFDAGNLMPGESREFTFTVNASQPGTFTASAKASSAEQFTADSSVTTTVIQPALTVACDAPDAGFIGRAFTVNFKVTNPSDVPVAGAVLEALIPAGVTFKSATAGGQVSGDKVVWSLGTIGPKAQQGGTATFVCDGAADFQFKASAKGTCAPEVAISDTIKTMGMAGILLENMDNPDPILVGENTVYTIKVTNQGTTPNANVRVVVTLADEVVPVVAPGSESIKGQVVTFPILPSLAPKEVVTYTVTAKGIKAGDAHTKFTLTSDVLQHPIASEESTHVYSPLATENP